MKITQAKVTQIDTSQMIEVDRLMMEEYHIELIQMMENAGRCLAIVARDSFLNGDPEGKKIAVLAGTGGNGGGAMVCARRLHCWGADIHLLVTSEENMTPIPGHQMKILKSILSHNDFESSLPTDIDFDLIIDGIIGYSVKGDPFGKAKEMIDWANSSGSKVLALDTPSGLDLTSGKVHDPTVRAHATLTLALPKKGLFGQHASERVGQLFLGDISVPPKLYEEESLGLAAGNVFRYSDIIRLT